ncbi:protein kinase [Streptomyces sp. NPDC060286]|uniref:serine/threonine-protein kinase n=1 Tax=unclassified Streptomyces TaxID=2593676 RepID=UPI0035DDF4D5
MIEPLPPGRARLIGPYQLLGLLGAGGMGEVYLARPAGARDPLGGLVALKTVRPDLDLDDGFRIRFRREIDAAGAVRSPHTAALVGGDANGRLPWLATEYVPGPSLAEAVTRGGPLPEQLVREVGAGLARALADMHAVRVLHRDLKPGNVLLGADGPKVIDFGIAQAFDATQLTRTGVVVGSPGYISPEHVNGSRALVPASDVFCLGAVLAFAAAGRGPFDDSDMAAVIFRISRGESELSGVPPRLRAVIEACLCTDAEARPTPRQLVGMLLPQERQEPPGGPAAGTFPWTEAVRGQLAAHAAGACACAEAAAPSAAAPAVPFHCPDPVGPALAPTPVVPVAVPGDGRGNRGLWIGLAAAATAVCAVLGTVLLPGLFGGGGDDGGGGTGGGGAGPTVSASETARTAAGPAVVPGADTGHTGDFGTAAADASTRLAGWQPWHVRIAAGRVRCLLADTSLVCGGPERITVLDAANGKRRWQTGPGRAGGGPASVAAVIGTTVYAFEDGALVALDLADGAEKWRDPQADGARVADSLQSGGVLYYATKSAGTGTSRIVAHRLTGTHARLWEKPWDDPAAEAELAFADGRLVVAGDGITVLKGADGAGLGAVAAGDVTCRTPVLKGARLLCSGPDGLTVVEVTAPHNRRPIADGLDVAYRPAVTRDGTVVVSTRHRVYAFGLADGRQIWATPDAVDHSGAPVVVGDRACLVTPEGYLESYDLAPEGQDGPVNTKRYDGWPEQRAPGADPRAVSLLVKGDVVFVGLDEGTVLSGYAP